MQLVLHGSLMFPLPLSFCLFLPFSFALSVNIHTSTRHLLNENKLTTLKRAVIGSDWNDYNYHPSLKIYSWSTDSNTQQLHPLLEAVLIGDRDLIKLLLGAGSIPRVDEIDINAFYPFQLPPKVKASNLIERKDTKKTLPEFKMTALMTLCMFSCYGLPSSSSTIKLLIKRGADVNMLSQSTDQSSLAGWSALACLCCTKQVPEEHVVSEQSEENNGIQSQTSTMLSLLSKKMETETMLGINASPHPLHLALSANNKMALDWITKHSTNYHVHYRHRKSKMELDDDLDKYNFEVRKHEQATFNWNQINDETRNAWKMESLQYLKAQLVSQQTESTNKIISNSFTTLAIALYADLNDIWVSRKKRGKKEEMVTKWPRLNYVRNHFINSNMNVSALVHQVFACSDFNLFVFGKQCLPQNINPRRCVQKTWHLTQESVFDRINPKLNTTQFNAWEKNQTCTGTLFLSLLSRHQGIKGIKDNFEWADRWLAIKKLDELFPGILFARPPEQSVPMRTYTPIHNVLYYLTELMEYKGKGVYELGHIKVITDILEIVRLLSENENVECLLNVKDYEGNTALDIAYQLEFYLTTTAREARTDLDELLAAVQTLIDGLTASGGTVTLIGCINRYKDWIARQLGYGPWKIHDPSSKHLDDIPQICEKALSDSGDDINQRTTHRGETALYLAAKSGNKTLVHWLLANSADPSILNHEGHGCLFAASTSGKTDVLDELLQHDRNALTMDLHKSFLLCMEAVMSEYIRDNELQETDLIPVPSHACKRKQVVPCDQEQFIEVLLKTFTRYKRKTWPENLSRRIVCVDNTSVCVLFHVTTKKQSQDLTFEFFDMDAVKNISADKLKALVFERLNQVNDDGGGDCLYAPNEFVLKLIQHDRGSSSSSEALEEVKEVVGYVQKRVEMVVSRKNDEENKVEETVGVKEQNEAEVGKKFSREPFPFELLPNEYFSEEAIHWSRIGPGRQYMQPPHHFLLNRTR